MNRGLALICVASLILGFQNCSQSALQGTGDLSSTDTSISMPTNLEADGGGSVDSSLSSKVTFVEIPNMSEDSSGGSQKAVSLSPYRLVISLQSGSINLMDDKNEVLEKKCLNSSSLAELKSIISGASICSATVQDSADLCAQKYTPGYASLYAEEQRIALGEEKDSCGRGRKDLCGGVSSVFQGYVDHIRQHWSEMDCE